MKLKRICIYPKDIQRITGKSDSYSRKLLREIKKNYKKKPFQLVSIKEFCEYTDLDESEVLSYLKD